MSEQMKISVLGGKYRIDVDDVRKLHEELSRLIGSDCHADSRQVRVLNRRLTQRETDNIFARLIAGKPITMPEIRYTQAT